MLIKRCKLRVKCPNPKCGLTFCTQSINRVKCFFCETSFIVCPKRERSNIIKIEKGTQSDLDKWVHLRDSK